MDKENNMVNLTHDEHKKLHEIEPGITIDNRTVYDEFWDTEIEDGFKYHKPNEEQIKAIDAVRTKSKELAKLIVDVVPEGAEKIQAITYLRQAGMFANAGIAINPADTVAYGEKERKY